MASLMALLSQQSQCLQTRKGLIVLGLQNDFISPKGKLPVPDTAFLDRLSKLIPSFREHGDIVWVRSEYENTRPVNGFDTPGDTVVAGGSSGQEPTLASSDDSPTNEKERSPVPTKKRKPSPKSSDKFSKPDVGEDDEELFLSRTTLREPCCVRGTPGAEFADKIKALIQPKDLKVMKTHYSAFGSTSLLMSLRSKLITDVYVCGCITNLSVYATAMDAARYGINIILVTDCLGYRRKSRHDLAIKQLRDLMSAETMTAEKVLEHLRNPKAEYDNYSEEEGGDDQSEVSENETHDYAANQNACLSSSTDVLEVDSDNSSDEEVSLPSVRPSIRLLDRRFELRGANESDNYSRAAACQPRFTSIQYAEPSSSKPLNHGPDKHTISRDRNRQRASFQSKFNTNSSNGKLSHIGASILAKQPWLNLIPSYRASLQQQDDKSNSSVISLPKKTNYPPTATGSGTRSMAQEDQGTTGTPRLQKPLFGEENKEASQGSQMIYDLVSAKLAESVIDELNGEVKWQTMYHQTGEVPRLVCCQATVGEDGSMPVYRHPSDQTLPTVSWTPTVDRIRKAAEQAVGHPLNHALIQLYRSGNDFISEHSDKTLDIAPGSNIVNVSFGAQRTMRLRTKRGAAKGESNPLPRTTYRISMPHNSMIVMSLKTNAQYLHGINWDKRPAVELIDAEKAYGGQRISLTFRNIGTFLNKDSSMIWGQGAAGRTKDQARAVVNGNPEASDKMVQAFGKENAASTIEWDEIYGGGFDVLHLKKEA